MADIEIIRPYVEQICTEVLGLEPGTLKVADNGDIPITYGSTVAYVRLLERENFPVTARVYAVVVDGVQKSPELLEYLNEVNSSIWSSRLFWISTSEDGATGDVIAADEIPAEEMQKDELRHVLWAVGTLADGQDDEIVSRFGGSKILPDPPTDGTEAEVEV
jgi:hypothetical protein